ncbi:MAG: single-stranded DNA-binding protein [Clostridiales Family XIII bacterium]|jgi:single-strand DNA-binding protein|nr:single-stranded DNA-binding protein [Clostridiales Family XIII bacterium]
MNVVILIGNLARDPEKSYSSNGMAVTRFTLAVNRITKKEGADTADFIRVVAFDKQAEFVERYFKKGGKIAVEGRIQTGSYDDKDGKKVYTTDVIANRLEFVERKEQSEGGWQGGASGGYSKQGGGGDSFGSQFENKGAAPAPDAAPDGFAEIDEGDDMPF